MAGEVGERLVVALVRGVHGLRGDVRVEVLTDDPERRFAPGSVLHREGDTAPLTVAASTAIVDGPGWRVRFREVADRTVADTLRGVYLEVELGPDDVLEEGAVYWHELIGVPVTAPDGTALGTVHDVYQVGTTETVIVRGGPPGEFDVPLVRPLVLEFEPRAGRIVVDPEALDLAGEATAHDAGCRPKAPRRRPGSRRRRSGTADAGAASG